MGSIFKGIKNIPMEILSAKDTSSRKAREAYLIHKGKKMVPPLGPNRQNEL